MYRMHRVFSSYSHASPGHHESMMAEGRSHVEAGSSDWNRKALLYFTHVGIGFESITELRGPN